MAAAREAQDDDRGATDWKRVAETIRELERGEKPPFRGRFR